MKTLIIGRGEVGIALGKVLDSYAPLTIDIVDSGLLMDQAFDIIHICFPYSKDFVSAVRAYQVRFKPNFTVIHSTVPVGTSFSVGAIHSPIRGIHPHLEEGIRTFVKFIGGAQASQVADYFRRAGLRICLFDRPETTELAKLLETECYRVSIEFAHRAKNLCDRHGLSYHEVYTLQAQTYNEGYTALGHPEYVRSILQPIMGQIGGHCVMPNKELLS